MEREGERRREKETVEEWRRRRGEKRSGSKCCGRVTFGGRRTKRSQGRGQKEHPEE